MTATDTDWVLQYLSYIKLEHKPPTFAYLSELCRAHLNRIPFENISKLIYFRDQQQKGYLVPETHTFVNHLYEYNFGGTCFTVNSNFKKLLDALGFSCYFVRLGDNHMGIVAHIPELNHERVYIDCGSAAPFFRPVRFDTEQQNRSLYGSENIRIIQDPSDSKRFRYVRYRNGELVSDRWTFDPAERLVFSDFLSSIHALNQPGTDFMTILRCQLWQEERGRNLSLVNRTLTYRYEDGSESKLELQSIEDIEAVIREEFQLPNMPVREAAKVLEGLGVSLFG